MTKIQIKSVKLTPFGGIFSVMDQFERILSPVIDRTLGLRCRLSGYRYSEIVRSLMCVYFCGGSCVEDVTSHLKHHLSLHPHLRTCSADTILRAIGELGTASTTYTSDSGKSYDFNTADRLNELLVDALISTDGLKADEEYDLDFDHQFIETEKHDAKPTYKKFLGYGVAAACIGDKIVGLEGLDGNVNVRFKQATTHERYLTRLEERGIRIGRFRADCGSCSKEIVEAIKKHCRLFYIRADRCSSLYDNIFALRGWKRVEINDMESELNSILVEKWQGKAYRLVIQRQRRAGGSLDLWEGDYTYRCILTNDHESSEKEIVEFYNKRGVKERYFDEMNNDFGWNRLHKSFLKENTVFILITALIRNFYKTLIARMPVEKFGLKKQAVSRLLPSGSYPYRLNGFRPQGGISSIYTPTTAPIERFSRRDPDNADCLLAQTAYCLKSLRGG